MILFRKDQKLNLTFFYMIVYLTKPFYFHRNVFKNEVGDLDLESGFGSIYKQESSRLTDDELLRMLQDLKK